MRRSLGLGGYDPVPDVDEAREIAEVRALLPFEALPASVPPCRLPIVLFSDEVDVQRVWYGGRVEGGIVAPPTRTPDVRAENPVVMSPAFLGFAIEPYEKRYLHYKGVGMIFARPNGGRFMQPSIDTMLVCLGLSRLFDGGAEVRRAVDVGSGSGFIGKFIAAKAPGSLNLGVTLVDIDQVAMEYCQSPGFGAPTRGHSGRAVAVDLRGEDAVGLLEADPGFDLIVSNPPYIPTLAEVRGSESRAMSGFWEGIGLVVYLTELVVSGRSPTGTHLVLMVSSLTLKAPRVRRALQDAHDRGFRVRVLVEREIGWKAWYAGPRELDHLLASGQEYAKKHRIAGCDFFVGATPPTCSRTGTDGRDRLLGYHWHYAYVVEIHKPP